MELAPASDTYVGYSGGVVGPIHTTAQGASPPAIRETATDARGGQGITIGGYIS